MPDWSIKIIPGSKGATFAPNPLPAEQDDLVSWNNTTDDTHQIEVTAPEQNPFRTHPIPAGEPSSPAYDVAQPPKSKPANWTATYRCILHADEQGTIKARIVPTPPTQSQP
ncbi:MAG TPA: hypothetical protein VKA60_24855 [Blastocatellia bacterium]|nr:hypothetical protein [Blastocatellia bacterium]